MNDPRKSDHDLRRDVGLPLSAEGKQRREAMLDVLLTEQRSRVETRGRRRVVAGAVCLLVLISAVVSLWPAPTDANRELAKSPVVNDSFDPPGATVSVRPAVLDYLESNSPTVTDRLVCSNVEEPRRVSLQHIDDDELMGLLEESGKPGTLGIIGGEKRVVFDRSAQPVQF